ncbi:hypothetical protein H0H93_007942, partial [Arthromyces matolae]
MESKSLSTSTSKATFVAPESQEPVPPLPLSPPGLSGANDVTHVDLDSIDPVGIEELRRSLSNHAEDIDEDVDQASFRSSVVTLNGPVDPAKFDFQKTLRSVIRKRSEAQIKSRTLGVVFRDLEVLGLGASDTYQPTLGSLFSYKTIQTKIRAARHPPVRTILSGFEGVVKPGEMLLVLGRPGSGCTTFLKTMANMRDEYHGVNGEVYYDSLTSSDIKNQYRGDVQYCPEDDVHFPTLTVEQTLNFSAKTRAPHQRAGMRRNAYVEHVTDVLTTLFGLRHAKKTPVGDAAIRILAFSIYTGYQIPKPTMIGALRWITYINPLRYGFESILTNEFRTLNGRCSTLIPSGPGYENTTIENQVCTTVGSTPASEFVNGARYALFSFSFKWSHTWMNFGILMAFAIGFIALLLLFSEFNTTLANESSVTLFKQGTKSGARAADADDEEALHQEKTRPNDPETRNETKEVVETMTDTFSWQHINYTVPLPGGTERRLLSDVTGFVAPGKLTALMGESGAGKTTLLNVLAQRVSVGVVTGDKFVNGQPLPRDFQSQTGYCQQMDTHEPTATVREALLFSAQLRQPPSVPLAEKKAYAEKCLKMCGLEAYGDAIVGSLSVEHRKRTTIAVELAAKPRLLLFLDEPTSGLDSQSAWSIMAFLRSLADNGQAILCTIHQPSAELFQVFDRMLLLRKGGQTVYFGDLGRNATTLINYFEKNGSRLCAPDENP